MAYSLAIEQAETFARRYHRLAFWVPIWGREFQIKAKMWDYTVERLKNHAKYLGQKTKVTRFYSPEQTKLAEGMQNDFCVPPRPSMADNVGFGE